MRQLFLELLTRDPLTAPERGQQFLAELARSPLYLPAKYGNTEPIKQRWNPAAPLEALPAWHRPFLWKGTRPRAAGNVQMATLPMHGCISLSLDDRDGAVEAHAEATAALLRRWFSLFDGDLGFVHALTPADIEPGRASGVVVKLDRAGTQHAMMLNSHTVVRYLPELYWAMAFGPSYVEHFGRERLLSAPAPLVEPLGEGGVYLQLARDATELASRPDEIARVRRAVKEHLGPASFFDPALGATHPYAVPRFPLELIPHSLRGRLATV